MLRGQEKVQFGLWILIKTCRYGGEGVKKPKKNPTALMSNKRKKEVDIETKSFMNGPLVRASGHVIHAHSPLLPSWSPELYCCVHTAVKT